MQVFDLGKEQVFNPVRHVEKVLGTIAEGDVTIACWDPGQVSPNHLHPNATEIYSVSKAAASCARPTRQWTSRQDHSSCIRRANCTNTPTARAHDPVPRALRQGFLHPSPRIWPSNPNWRARPEDAASVQRMHERSLALRRADEAQDADLRRPAGNGTARRVVAAIQDQVIGYPTPFAFDQRLVVTIAEPRVLRPAIGHRAAQRVGPWLAQTVEPGCERRIGIGRRRCQDRACEASHREQAGLPGASGGNSLRE